MSEKKKIDPKSVRQVLFGKTADELWKLWLTEGVEGFYRLAPPIPRAMIKLNHKVFKAIPSDPRCVNCYAPFTGPGAPFMRAFGRERSILSPSLCEDCENQAKKYGARAEVPVTMLFADIRGSTSLAEKMDAREFSNLVSKFYSTASNILVDSHALIDKLIGDEVSAFWVPGYAGKDHPKIAFESALDILKATGNKTDAEAWVPVGIGIHTGTGVVGAVGTPDGMSDITVLGDTANTAARLASQAGIGEIVLSDEIAKRAGLDTTELKAKSMLLKGKAKAIDTWTYSSS